MGHSVARVQKVQKVQRVQRVAVAADAADYKKRARLRRGLYKRVASHRENDSLHFVRRSAPSKCVRCASLRSGGRSGALKAPYPACHSSRSKGSLRETISTQKILQRETAGFDDWQG